VHIFKTTPKTTTMAIKRLAVSIVGEKVIIFWDDVSFSGKGAEDIGHLGCKV
jgi:hypothetical protein